MMDEGGHGIGVPSDAGIRPELYLSSPLSTASRLFLSTFALIVKVRRSGSSISFLTRGAWEAKRCAGIIGSGSRGWQNPRNLRDNRLELPGTRNQRNREYVGYEHVIASVCTYYSVRFGGAGSIEKPRGRGTKQRTCAKSIDLSLSIHCYKLTCKVR